MLEIGLINVFGVLALYFFFRYNDAKSSLDSYKESLEKAYRKIEDLEITQTYLREDIENRIKKEININDKTTTKNIDVNLEELGGL
jgi:translation elongation factor EF-1beta